MKNFFLTIGLIISSVAVAQSVKVPANTSDTLYNTLVGHDTSFNTTGVLNAFYGFRAGKYNTNKSYNTFIGSYAGYRNKGEANTFVGHYAGGSNGPRDTAPTNDSIYIHNSFIGTSAGREATGNDNTFLGWYAGSNARGNHNVCVGSSPGNKAGNNNIYIGTNTGQNSTLNNNVMIGHQSGKFNTGASNVFLGYQSGANDITASNKLYIANSSTNHPLIYGEFTNGDNTPVVKFNANKVGIGYENIAGGKGFGDFPTAASPDLSTYRLFVKGGILASEVRVRTDLWPDYVFNTDYVLQPLSEVEQYIADNGHLPNMPSAEAIESEGLELGNIVKLQQEKIEELTLHLIDQNKQIEELKSQMQLLLNKK